MFAPPLSSVHAHFQTIHDHDDQRELEQEWPSQHGLAPSSSSSSSFSSVSSAKPSTSTPALPTHYAPYGFSGDGWSQLLLPIPPQHRADPLSFLRSVQAAWEEESRLLALGRAGRTRVDPRYRVGEDMQGKAEVLLRLPGEVWREVGAWVLKGGREDAAALARVNKSFHALMTPLLYGEPCGSSGAGLDSLICALRPADDGCPSPRLAHVHSLSLRLAAADWAKAEELGRLLCGGVSSDSGSGTPSPSPRPLRTLTLHCAGSDLSRSLPLLSSLLPVHFRWHTSPCWLLRPASLFASLLKTWRPALKELSLQGFCWDSSFVASLAAEGGLEVLRLSGRTMSSLGQEGVRGLLDPEGSGVVPVLDEDEDDDDDGDGDGVDANGDTDMTPASSAYPAPPPTRRTNSTPAMALAPMSSSSMRPTPRRALTSIPTEEPHAAPQRPRTRLRLRQLVLEDLPPGKGTAFAEDLAALDGARAGGAPAWTCDCRDYGSREGKGCVRFSRRRELEW